MKKLTFLIMIICLAIMLNGCALDVTGEDPDTGQTLFGANVYSKEEEAEITLNGHDTLYIPGDREDVTVKVWDKDYIYVKAYKKVKTSNKARAEHYVDLIKLVTEKNSKQVKIYIQLGDTPRLLAQQYALLEVSIPESIKNIDISTPYGMTELSDIKDSANIVLKSDGGKISVKNIYTDKFSINMGAGDIVASQVFGDGEIISKTGKTDISETKGNLKISTESGKYNIFSHEGSLNADIETGILSMTDALLSGESTINATTGDIDVQLKEIHPESNLNFRSTAGRINMRIPSKEQFDVSAKAVSGRVRTNFKVSDKKISFGSFIRNIFSSKNAVGKVNGGGPLISVETDSGTIIIKKSS